MTKQVREVLHTPGPWKVFEHRDHSGLEVGPPYGDDEYNGVLKGCVKDVCTMRSLMRNEPTEEQRANARLIAAAPELLISLREMVAGFGFAVNNGLTAKLIERAAEVIKKAEGEQ